MEAERDPDIGLSIMHKQENQKLCYLYNFLFWAVILALIFSKLYLVEAQRLCIFGSSVDDRLFVELAKNIGEGHWLGAYDNRTLIKVPVYPLWIAMIGKLKLPLIFSQHVLYILACLVFVYVIEPVVKRKSHLLIIFCILLFNPMTYSHGIMNMVFRVGIYPSLALLVVSITTKNLMMTGSSVVKRFLWFAVLGIFLSAFWLTREESVWIIPYFSFILLWHGFRIIKNRNALSLKVEASLWLMPFSILFMSILTVCTINNLYYGVFATTEIKTEAFQSAYGALLRLRQKSFVPAVHVTSENRQRIYEVSDEFRELKPFLEGQIGKKFVPDLYTLRQMYEKGQVNSRVDQQIQHLLKYDKSGIWRRIWKQSSPDNSDILGISFIWAFRDSVSAAGHYGNWANAQKFYTQLAAEINKACEAGQLDCLRERHTLIPPWRSEYIIPLIKTFFFGCYAIASTSFFDPNPTYCSDDPVALALYKKVTGENTGDSIAKNTAGKDSRIRLMETIGKAYQFVFFLITGVSIILYILCGVRNLRERNLNSYWCMATSLVISLFSLFMGLAYIHVTSFPAIEMRYLGPAYPLTLVFCIFTWFAWRRYPWPFNGVRAS